MNFPSRAWLGNFATQALAEAVGAVLAGSILVLGAALFGDIKSLDTTEVVAITVLAVALAGALAGASLVWRDAGRDEALREQAEMLIRYIAEERERARRRDDTQGEQPNGGA